MSLTEFWAEYSFEPDRFQLEAAEAIAGGHSVVVTAPTGAGKTLIAEAATHLARRQGRRVFYTTPIKALSNQKFADMAADLGASEVGLLTGDNVINPEAPVIVATLEVLRNMIYADPANLDDVAVVVLDEAHYLQDRHRGAAWEEVIIHCPQHIQFVCLSATISNKEQFTDWIEERRGPTRLITTDERPVPLEPMYLLKEKSGGRRTILMETFVERDGRRRTNPRLEHALGLEKGRRRKYRTPSRFDVVETLAGEGMLPAIYFIFSRAGCDAASSSLSSAGLGLTSPEDREEIRATAEAGTAHLSDEDLAVLGYGSWLQTLESGVAAHHAGLVPAFKETVESLFERGLIKVVFATETLALGINMPARSVVIENLSKFNGDSHELLKAGDYTQLTGRAGRRGIDKVGYGVVLHSPFVSLRQATEIAAQGAHELTSSFRPTYNMTANLVAKYEEEQAEKLIRASFAAFQRSETRQETGMRIDALEEQLGEQMALAECERGDIGDYMATIEAAPPSHRRDGISALLGPGAVLDVNGGSRDGRYLVLKRLSSKNGGSRYLVLGTSGRVSTLGYKQIPQASGVVARVELPRPFRPRDRRFVQGALRELRRVPPRTKRMSKPKENEHIEHPVAGCPDASRHLAALRRARRIRVQLDREVAGRRRTAPGLAGEFAATRSVLTDLGYLEGWSLTSRGERLRRVYNESDLILVEAVERGIFYDLDPAELAAILSVFVFDPRSDQKSPPRWPSDELSQRWTDVEDLADKIAHLEAEHRLVPMRQPDPGFGHVAYAWTAGVAFEDLTDVPLAPGDFVRVSRQLVDILRQIRDGVSELRSTAAEAIAAVDRGVVAAQGGW